jgi:hypothetical protein
VAEVFISLIFILEGRKLAGTCAFCKYREGKKLGLNDEIIEIWRCVKGRYDKDGLDCYFGARNIMRQCKTIAEIQEKCGNYEVDYNIKSESQS